MNHLVYTVRLLAQSLYHIVYLYVNLLFLSCNTLVNHPIYILHKFSNLLLTLGEHIVNAYYKHAKLDKSPRNSFTNFRIRQSL